MTEHERDARDLRILARRDRGWTIKAIAADAGLSISAVFKFLRGGAMTTPHIKVSQEDAETLFIRMDRAGFEIFRRLIVRAQAIPEDDRQRFTGWRDRILGAFLAGGAVMGWVSK